MNATKARKMTTERGVPLRLSVHPDAPALQRWRRWAEGQVKPRAVDLFSGCGGLSLGLHQAGYSVVLSVDTDPWAIETHRNVLPGPVLDLDLADPIRKDSLVSLLDGMELDVIAGGPPCQPFSRAGRAKIRSLVAMGVRPEKDERTELWQSFLEIIERVRPRAVLMENVPGLALEDELTVVRIMAERLERIGYDVDSRLLEAARHGVPQYRHRFFLVATNDGRQFRWPAEKKPLSLRAAIGDLPSLGAGVGAVEMPAGRPRTEFQRRARVGMNGLGLVWDHVTRAVRADDLEAFRLMTPETKYSDLPSHLRRYRADIFDDKYNRLSWNAPSRCITAHLAKDGYWYIHPQEHRTITVREAARIQTFPDRVRFAGTRTQALKQIGNAVPPALAEAIGTELLRARNREGLRATERSARRLEGMRKGLLMWARKDARRAPWRHPGNPWLALAGVVLADRSGGADDEVRSFVENFPAPEVVRRKAFCSIGAEAASASLANGYTCLGEIARHVSRHRDWERVEWARLAELNATEESLVRMIGFGEDRVIPSAATLRVVGRVLGEPVAAARRTTDGRIMTGRILGAADAPAIGAALHALGRTLCAPRNPDCGHCPLARECASEGD